jgi:DNA-binding response OmpR family regulator
VAALDAGANDYLIKPMRNGEIVARVQVLLKRAYPEQHAGELMRFGRYVFETATTCVKHDQKTIKVTQKEFDLALLFFEHLGRPLSRAYIREMIWPGESELPSRTLDTHVSRVRSKLGLRPENGFRLSPVYSYGYELEQLS